MKELLYTIGLVFVYLGKAIKEVFIGMFNKKIKKSKISLERLVLIWFTIHTIVVLLDMLEILSVGSLNWYWLVVYIVLIIPLNVIFIKKNDVAFGIFIMSLSTVLSFLVSVLIYCGIEYIDDNIEKKIGVVEYDLTNIVVKDEKSRLPVKIYDKLVYLEVGEECLYSQIELTVMEVYTIPTFKPKHKEYKLVCSDDDVKEKEEEQIKDKIREMEPINK